MTQSPLLTLGLKFVLLLVPLGIVLALYAPHAQSPYYVQTSILHDKIDRIVKTEDSQIIVGGESRALYSVVPLVITKETKLSAANIAVGGGILSEMYSALNESELLDAHRLIIISVSSYQTNDAFADNFPSYKRVIDEEPLGIHKIADATTYYQLLFASYFYDFKKFLRGDTTDTLHIDNTTLNTKGYRESVGVFDPTTTGEVTDNPWYTRVRTDGTRERDFLRAIESFGTAPATIVIYTGPLAPSWREKMKGSRGAAIEAQFAQTIRDAIAPYPNLQYLDFQFADIPGLTDTSFGDITHLNKTGAPLFTAFLVQTLRAQGIIQ